MLKQGQWLSAGIVALALTVAGFSWYWNVQATRRCVEFWGPEAALLIASSPTAELLQLAEPSENLPAAKNAAIHGASLAVSRKADVSQARGFSNVRRMLVQDRSFDWTTAPSLPSHGWKLALRFGDEKANSLVLLAPEACLIALDGKQGTAVLDPAAAKILENFAAENFGAENSALKIPPRPGAAE